MITETHLPASRRKSSRSAIPAFSAESESAIRRDSSKNGVLKTEASEKASEFHNNPAEARRLKAAFHSFAFAGTYGRPEAGIFFQNRTKFASHEEATKFVSKTAEYHFESATSSEISVRADANSSASSNAANSFASAFQRISFGLEETFAPTAPRFQKFFNREYDENNPPPESKHALSLSASMNSFPPILSRKGIGRYDIPQRAYAETTASWEYRRERNENSSSVGESNGSQSSFRTSLRLVSFGRFSTSKRSSAFKSDLSPSFRVVIGRD